LKCDEVLEKVGLGDFNRSDDEREFFEELCEEYGLDNGAVFPVCKSCDLVYPYVYHSPDVMVSEEAFGCSSCGYFLEIFGVADEFPMTDKIFFCPDCLRRGLSESYYGFVEVPGSTNKYFLPLSREQLIERFAFLESGSEGTVDLAYYSEAFAQDPDYVINRLGNQDCLNFILVLKHAYDYEEPEVEDDVEEPVVEDVEEVDEVELFDNAIPPCPNHTLFEEFVVEPNCLYLKTKVDKTKNVKNIGTFAFLFIVSVVFMFSVKGQNIGGSSIVNGVVFDLAAMAAFVTLSILIMSIAVNYFNLFYYMELTCENAALTVDIHDKVQNDHWQFNNAKSICLAQYSKKKKKTFTVELDAPISTSTKSHSGVRTIGLYIYQQKKRYLIKLPFSHLQIKWIGIVIREACKSQGIIKVEGGRSTVAAASAPAKPVSSDDIPETVVMAARVDTTPKEDAMEMLSHLIGPESNDEEQG